MKSRVLTVLALCLACLMLICSCGPKYEPKTFIVGNMTIELNDGFEQNASSNYDAVFVSQKIGVYITEEEFEDLGNDDEAVGEITLAEYAESLIEGSKLNTSVVLDKGLTTFTYEVSSRGEKFTYYNVVYKSEKSFWLVQFATKSERFAEESETIRDYAWSVEFS